MGGHLGVWVRKFKRFLQCELPITKSHGDVKRIGYIINNIVIPMVSDP